MVIFGTLGFLMSDTASVPERPTTARAHPGLDPEFACIFSTFTVCGREKRYWRARE